MMTEDEFMQRISPSIQNIITVFNAILDDAENNGLYPQGELDLLEEDYKENLKNYDSLPEEKQLEAWRQLGDMAGVLAKGKKDKFPSIDAIWDILASLEKFSFCLIDSRMVMILSYLVCFAIPVTVAKKISLSS